jgi:RNA polymerase sigma-70 factor (family 1)
MYFYAMDSAVIPDHQLWLSVQQGNRQAFDELYQRYAQPIFASVYRHIDNRHDAEDLTQEVFMNMWVKREQISIASSLFNYLFSVARYKTLRYMREKAIRPAGLDGLLLLEEPVEMAPTTLHLRDVAARVAQEVAALPEKMKKVYELNQDKGLSVSEIATQLHISPNTVRNHLAKVRTRLRSTVSRLSSFFFSLL